ncbi:MAG TPA: lycopene cyclase domain-containing protein, partial [Anaerolineales bacterium]
MTYFGFLLRFLVLPVAGLLAFGLWKARGKDGSTGNRRGRALWLALAAQVLAAVLYTTPWDNYLVATHVWTYSPGQVSGILLGYVPIEEYTFFILEAILVAQVWQFLRRAQDGVDGFRPSGYLRLGSCGLTLAAWACTLIVLLKGWVHGTYLGLILLWALPPIAIQLAFGADILWRQRSLLAPLIATMSLYLSMADSLAIRSGIWAIEPRQSTGLLIGRLPVEEALFFVMTVMLLSFGMTLSLSSESRSRLRIRAP